MRREPSERDTATSIRRRTMIKAPYFNDAATMGSISIRSLIFG